MESLREIPRSKPRQTGWSTVLMCITMGATLGWAACDRDSDGPVGEIDHGIIAGFPANDPALDAIGSLVIHFDGGPFGPPGQSSQELCGATLIGPETVLTAKHCALIVPLIISLGGRLTFAVGPNSAMPTREVSIAGIELAPGDEGGFVGAGHDVSVMHLETPITDLVPVGLAVPVDDHVGQRFAAIGYGVQDNTGANGTRRLGAQTLRSRQGRVFEALFGSFDNFFEWFQSGTVPASATALDMDGGVPSDDAGPVRPGVDGGPPLPPMPPTLEEFARQIYDSVVLDEGYEVVTGGAPGDAQPCFGDSGSSLIRRQQGQFVSFGVVSGGIGSRDLICDLGTVYATFGAGVLEFLQTARQWVDPCGDMDSHGACDGNTAVRCTNLAEGRRRVVSFDCGSLEMTCNTGGGQVSCDGNALAPPPPPAPRPGMPDPRREADKVFMTVEALAARHAHP
jgi:hypothetical protein